MKALLLINYLCILDFTVVENVLKEHEEDSCVISKISNLAIISSYVCIKNIILTTEILFMNYKHNWSTLFLFYSLFVTCIYNLYVICVDVYVISGYYFD